MDIRWRDQRRVFKQIATGCRGQPLLRLRHQANYKCHLCCLSQVPTLLLTALDSSACISSSRHSCAGRGSSSDTVRSCAKGCFSRIFSDKLGYLDTPATTKSRQYMKRLSSCADSIAQIFFACCAHIPASSEQDGLQAEPAAVWLSNTFHHRCKCTQHVDGEGVFVGESLRNLSCKVVHEF